MKKKNPYLSLELKDNTNIPFTLNFKSFYSSLALLIYDKLIGLKNEPDYYEGLKIIFTSRLYWILRYCLWKILKKDLL